MRRWWRRCAGQSSREELFPFGVGRAGDELAGGGGPGGGRRVARGVSNEVDRGACGWRSACAPNEFGLQGPAANGRPAPTGRMSFASAEADARRAAPKKADFQFGAKAYGRRSACADRGGVFCVGGGQRLARSALEGRFQSARAASAATMARSRRQGLRIEGSSFRNDGCYHRGTGSGRESLLHKATTVGSRRQGLRCGKPFPQK